MAVTAKVRCTVQRIVDHGRRVYTLDLLPQKPIPRFLPGQFLHLAIDQYQPADFWPDSRIFSIASPPADRNLLRITYSVVGSFTTRMERELCEGRQVWVKLPYGEFRIGPGRDAVLFAGGTGITAFTAFLEGLTAHNSQRITLFYGAADGDLLIYRPLTERVKHQLKQVQVFYFSEERPRGDSEWEPDHIGRLSVATAWRLIPEPSQSAYYLSGPPRMLTSMTQQLLEQKLPREAIHIDAW